MRYHDAWRALVGAKWVKLLKYHSESAHVILHSGVLVPGGFGSRGTEGMILAAKWAREQNRPFLGICLGFQIAVVEWARSVCGWTSRHLNLWFWVSH